MHLARKELATTIYIVLGPYFVVDRYINIHSGVVMVLVNAFRDPSKNNNLYLPKLI